MFTGLFVAPAFADCSDDVCVSLQKILQERSGNFAKLKGRPSAAPKGDQGWEGSQPIPGLMNFCFIYAREGAHHEYRCETSGLEGGGWLAVDTARQVANALKTALRAADPKLVWFVDPDSFGLARISGFEASEAWYGGYAPNRLVAKVSIFGSDSTGTTVGIIVFAKPLARSDLR